MSADISMHKKQLKAWYGVQHFYNEYSFLTAFIER